MHIWLRPITNTLPKESQKTNTAWKKSDGLIKGITTVIDSVLFKRKQKRKKPSDIKVIVSLSPYK